MAAIRLLLCAIALGICGAQAFAQPHPTRPIWLVLLSRRAAPPIGRSRLFAQTRRVAGEQVVIDYRGGAGVIIGNAAAKKSCRSRT